MIKVVHEFLPRPLFDYLKSVVEHESEMFWNFNARNLQDDNKSSGGEQFKFGRTLFVHSNLTWAGKEIYDKELMPLFGVFKSFIEKYMQDKCKPSKMIRMKLNLYPNQGTNVKHGVHNDIQINDRPRPDIVTSVFNFNTCNGSTIFYEKDEDGNFSDKSKKVEVPSIENSIVIFNNTHPHYGITQSDTPARIVLNTNIEKHNTNDNDKPIDDYF